MKKIKSHYMLLLFAYLATVGCDNARALKMQKSTDTYSYIKIDFSGYEIGEGKLEEGKLEEGKLTEDEGSDVGDLTKELHHLGLSDDEKKKTEYSDTEEEKQE